MGTINPIRMASFADLSPRHNAKKKHGPDLPNTTSRTKNLHSDAVSYHAAGKHFGSSHDIRIDEQNRRHEERGWEFERQKELAVRHRSASAGSHSRMNSWQQPATSAQAEWNSKQKKVDKTRQPNAIKGRSEGRNADVSMSEKIARERRNQADKVKKKHYENTQAQTMKIQEMHRAKGLEGQRGEEHDHRVRGTKKYIEESNWHHDAKSGRTAAARSDLLKSAVVKPSNVEHSSTHRKHGHMSEAELQDYMGLKQGEELDDEGRVIPPWAVQEKRAARYLGPMGEDYTKYNSDYPGVDVEGAAAWSARPPPPQMYLRDERGTNVRRSDPRLPHDPAGYGQPFHGPYARMYESPAAIASGYGYPSESYPAAYDLAAAPALGYGYGPFAF